MIKNALFRKSLNINTLTVVVVFWAGWIFDLTPDGALTPIKGAVDGEQL